jgi:hypothetical protein
VNRGDVDAILRRSDRNPRGGAKRSYAIQVLWDYVRIPGNVLAKVLGNQARVRVITSADGSADDQVHGLTLVEFSDGGGWSETSVRFHK